jgi:hypothetical protein
VRVVAALGGNALLERGERPDAGIQRHHVRQAAAALAPLAADHQLVVCHGNGPQVGVLALESQADTSLSRAYPLDVLVAQTQGRGSAGSPPPEFVRRWNCVSGKKTLAPSFKTSLSIPTTITWAGPVGVCTTSRCPTRAPAAWATSGPSTTTAGDVAVSPSELLGAAACGFAQN